MKRYLINFFLLVFIIFCSCSQSSDELKIMTFNIRYGTADDGVNSWQNRKSILLQVLRKHQPDILGTQEALDFQIDEIKVAFPDWEVFGVGRYAGIELSDRPYESRGGESCRIFYDTSKFKLIDKGTFWHSDTLDVSGSMTWGNTLPRITTWGIFQIKNRDKKFVVMNTHYHWDEPYVTNTSNLIMKKWREIAADLPSILMGDFNLSPTSMIHQLFVGKMDAVGLKGSFIDPWQALHKSENNAGTYNGFTGDKTGDRIDWILVTSQFKIMDIKIIHDSFDNRYPSDHFPVLANLKF